MSQELFYVVFNTAAGWMGIIGSSDELLCNTLPQPSEQEVYHLFGNNLDQAAILTQRFEGVIERLRAYFSGHRVEFPDKLDLSGATPFQRDVWQAARLIPYGQTRSYAWVAGRIGKPKAARAVGQALGRNPLPVIVPCHRVVAGDGGLGGFSGGIEMKRFLLRLEGKSVDE